MKTTHKIGEYIRLSQQRKLVLWRLSNKKWYFKHNGEWINKDMFNEYYPEVEYKKYNDKGENPDWKNNL